MDNAVDWLQGQQELGSSSDSNKLNRNDLTSLLAQVESKLGGDDFDQDGMFNPHEMTNLWLMLDSNEDNIISASEIESLNDKLDKGEDIEPALKKHRLGVVDAGQHLEDVTDKIVETAMEQGKTIEINPFVRDRTTEDISPQIEAIGAMSKNGATFSGLNFSIGDEIDYDEVNHHAGHYVVADMDRNEDNDPNRMTLSKYALYQDEDCTGHCVTPKTLKGKGEDVRAYLQSEKPEAYNSLRALQKLSDESNIPLYIAAGNDFSEKDWAFNVLSTVEGENVHVVSLKDPEGVPYLDYTQNSTVTHWVETEEPWVEGASTSLATPFQMVSDLD